MQRIGTLYPDAHRIYLALDNWPAHAHPKVHAALAAEPRVELLWLPTYAPWLNAAEKLWRWVKQRVTHTHPWSNDFPVFRQQIRDEFARLAPGSPQLLHYCGLDKLHS